MDHDSSRRPRHSHLVGSARYRSPGLGDQPTGRAGTVKGWTAPTWHPATTLPANWVELAEEGQAVTGVIIALEDDQKLRRALAATPNIAFYRYQVSLKLVKA